jgi:hypothetical protein
MRIVFRRSGGFAGTTLRTTIETDDLPEDQGRELEGLLQGADLTHLPPAPRRLGADRFHYAIEITAGDRRETLSFGEGQLTERARRLVERLEELARGRA